MVTKWEYSLETESLRILHAARQTAVGFYKTNHFIVLPKSITPFTGTVYLPELPYLSIPRFWDLVRKINVDTMPITAPKTLVEAVKKLLVLPSEPSLNKLKNLWDIHQNEIINCIYELIPSKKDSVTEIIILPTSFGTGCSFNLHQETGPVYIWLREGATIYSIVEAILTSLTRLDIYNTLGGVWAESEIITDWLIAFSPLAKLLHTIDPVSKFEPTMKTARAIQKAKLLQESENYMRKIGAPSIDNSAIKQIDISSFSAREKELFNLLLTKSPALVTMDEIGEKLFTNPNDFSLYAISKSIQRLRDRLEQNGISGSFIQTKRGEGYLLTN